MNNTLLSVLIPCTPDRMEDASKLISLILNDKTIDLQTSSKIDNISSIKYWGEKSEIEILVFIDNKEMTIGEKRELLYKHAKGTYSIQVDSDDLLSPNAIELMLEAIKSNPEMPCITFKERCLMDGILRTSNHSIIYDKWQDNYDGYDYVRTPFYKDVIRTDIAKSVPFERIRWNEDERWSYAIKHLLTDEIHIEEELYYYTTNSTSPHERYGYDKDIK